MVQKRYSQVFKHYENPNTQALRSSYNEIQEGAIEWNLAALGLIFSLSILITKIIFANYDNLCDLVFEKQLVQYKTVITDGEVLLHYAWRNVWKYSKFWFPAVCGGLLTWFTWLIVFLDSCVPGVTPPTPLSPTQFKVQSGHTFHLNYIFSIIIGVLVTAYMYAKGISLEF